MENKLEGYMNKWTNCCQGWKLRYFILRENVLNYYVERGARVKGKIHITICEINPDSKNVKRFEINTGTLNIYLEVLEEPDRKKWIDMLMAIKKRGQLLIPVKDKTVDQSQVNTQNNLFTTADIKVLKRLYTTKELISLLIKSNKQINELLSSEEINKTALKNLTDNYKVNIFVIINLK